MNPFEKITVSNIGSLTTVPRSKGEVYHVTHRTSYAISFCLSGKITYVHNGKHFVSDPEHAILLPMGQKYELHCTATGEFPVINFYCTEDYCPDEFFTVAISNIEPYLNDYETLQHLAMLRKNDYRVKSLAVLYDIVSRLAAEAKPASLNPVLTPAIEYIEENIDRADLSLTALANVSRISEVYLRRLFNREFGVSPKQYITRLRISRAKQLLKNSGTPISRVAENCGYSSVYHFSRAFKTATGYTPSEYRSQQSQLML